MKHLVILVFVALTAGGCANLYTQKPDGSIVSIKTGQVVSVPHNNGVTVNTTSAALTLTGGQAFAPEQAIEVLEVNNERIEIETEAAVEIHEDAAKAAAARQRAYEQRRREREREQARLERDRERAKQRLREQRLDAAENISRDIIRGIQRARSNR